MLTYQASTTINAPVPTVWPVLADVVRWNNWTPTVTKVEALEHSEIGLGRRFRVYQPKLQPTVWTVTALDAPSSFTWEARMPGLWMVAEHTLTAAANQTALVLKFSFGGALGFLVGKMYKSLIEDYLATEAASLRKRVER